MREHASALVLASLGAAHDGDALPRADPGSPSAWYYSAQGHLPFHHTVASGTTAKKRKRDYDDDVGLSHDTQRPPATTTLTWPSLEFSESLGPLEVRLNIGGTGGSGNYQVTVASCIAEAMALSQTWEEAEAATSPDSQCSLDKLIRSDTDDSQSSQEPEPSQSSDWHFLASQTSSFVLEELPDSQPSSQTNGYSFWC